MKRRPGIAILIIGFLAVLGILVQLSANPSSVLIPLAVFGVIFLLWKFPPQTWRRGTGRWNARPRAGTSERSKASRRAKFRVIQGNRNAREEEEPPKYH